MEFLLVVAGILVGYILATFARKFDSIGTLKVITDDDHEPYLFLDLDEDIYYVNDYLANNKYATFLVKYYDHGSHE